MSQSTFGKYRLLAELGHGGMADVFLAVAQGPEGLGFTKLVVVKRLRPNLAEDPEFIAMLVDEARIAARLNHPNAVQTYEIGQVGAQYFISMEYLDGQPLNRIATRAKKAGKELPLAYQLSILADVCAGLHHAHELLDYDGKSLGIVHRDVTPHNIFVTYDGQVKLVDFGIAKAAGRASETKAGIVKGKVVYMAPEQASGQEVDRRADIFAVGVMMWELLTGTRMWAGFDELGVMARLITRDLPGPPSTLLPTVDPVLDKICARAVAPRAPDRYDTAEEMATDILRYLNSKGERPLHRDLGGVVSELFLDRRRETKEVIETQLTALEKNGSSFRIRELPTGSDASLGAVPVSSGSNPSIDEQNPADPTRMVDSSPKASAGQFSSVKTLVEGDVSGSKKRPLNKGAIAAAAVLILGVGGYALLDARAARSPAHTDPVALPQPPSVTSGAPATEQDATVAVSLSSEVPETSFRIDGQPPVSSPYSARLKKDDRAHVVIATAPGHDDARYEVRFDADVAWKAPLKAKEDAKLPVLATKKPGASGARPSTPAVTAVTSAAVVATTATTASAARPGVIDKPRRSIDEDNPYEKKKVP